MNQGVVRHIVQAQGATAGAVRFLVVNANGWGWESGPVGRHRARRFEQPGHAEIFMRQCTPPRGYRLQVVAVTERPFFVIRAASVRRTFWLKRIGQTTQYRWGQDGPGLLAAYRWETREEAEGIRVRNGGAGGVTAEVVEVLFLDD